MIDKTKKIIVEFIKKVIGKTAEEVAIRILFLVGAAALGIKWQTVIKFLQVNIQVSVYLIMIMLITTLIVGYLIGKPKKRKWWFEPYHNALWKVVQDKDEVFVEGCPYCQKCSVKYVVVTSADYYDKCYNMICPTCGDKKENYPVTVILDAVTNIANAKFHGHYK